ncbi:uncharacterized protein LOC135200544 [Macrobrachium nipponense]|uniref:uncharacterized protein LOC135200544 n=1 Tax=Macrobrachium nipponense TaxID=159736 RepID=UPI0030C868F7
MLHVPKSFITRFFRSLGVPSHSTGYSPCGLFAIFGADKTLCVSNITVKHSYTTLVRVPEVTSSYSGGTTRVCRPSVACQPLLLIRDFKEIHFNSIYKMSAENSSGEEVAQAQIQQSEEKPATATDPIEVADPKATEPRPTTPEELGTDVEKGDDAATSQTDESKLDQTESSVLETDVQATEEAPKKSKNQLKKERRRALWNSQKEHYKELKRRRKEEREKREMEELRKLKFHNSDWSWWTYRPLKWRDKEPSNTTEALAEMCKSLILGKHLPRKE